MDINKQILQSYYSLLNGSIEVDTHNIPVYSYQVPTGLNPDNFILINIISAVGSKDFVTKYKNIAVQLMIVTKSLQNNSGAIANDIASQIEEILYPNTIAIPVSIVDGKVITTELTNDITLPGLTDGQKKVVNRVLTFSHNIELNKDVTPADRYVYYGVQSTGADPVDFNSYITQNPAANINIKYPETSVPKFFWMAHSKTASNKTDWRDNRTTGNAGAIGSGNLFSIRNITIEGAAFSLYMTNYLTDFTNGNDITFFNT